MRKSKLLSIVTLLSAIFMWGCGEPIEEPAPDAPFVVSPAELNFEAEGNSAEVAIEAGGRWEAKVVEGTDWIGIDKSSGDAGVSVLTVTAWRNTADDAREGMVEITSGEATKQVIVHQKGVKVTAALPEATKKNTYLINGIERAFGSTAVMMVDDNVLVAATPESGKRGAEAILECEEYFYGAVSPLLVDKSFDVMTEEVLYTIASTLAGATLEGVAPLFREEVTAGGCQLTSAGDVLTLKVGLILADGTQMAVWIEAKNSGEINENKISRGEEEKPLRAAFYHLDDEMTALYFTPAGIDYFAELEIASWYLYVMVDNSLLSGESVDVAEIGDRLFMFGVVDNVTGEVMAISNEDMQGATGNLLLSSLGEERYLADLAIEVEGIVYKVAFSGLCKSSAVEPEIKINYITYKGREYDLTGASIDTSSEVWSVELMVANGKVITATIPQDFFTGQAKGFSQSPALTVTYLERTYSKANGDSGTIIASYDEEGGHLDLEFMGYGDLSFVYSGDCTQK